MQSPDLRPWLVGLIALCSFLHGCTAGPDFYTRDGQLLRDSDPAPFRIAISEVEVREDVTPALEGREGGLPLAFAPAELRTRLVENMRALNAASGVFEVARDSDVTDAVNRGADLLLRPRLTACRLGYSGRSNSWLLSTALWLTTWIGGLVVEDSAYRAQLELEWEVINIAPDDEQRIARVATATSSDDLTLLDRHSFLSLGTLQSVLLPPVICADSDASTSEALSQRAAARSAAQLTQYLKGGLGGEERELLGKCRIERPRNGGVVGDTVQLHGLISARALVTALQIHANDQPVLTMEGDQMPSRLRQKVGSLYEVELPGVEIPMQPGANRVLVSFEIEGIRTTRTLVLHNELEAGN